MPAFTLDLVVDTDKSVAKPEIGPVHAQIHKFWCCNIYHSLMATGKYFRDSYILQKLAQK